MSDTLQFWVGLSSTMARIQRINKINSATLNLQLNNGGNAALTIDKSDQGASVNVVIPLTNCILIYRDGSLVWSGPIWTVEETVSGEQSKINITAVGWFELLNHRILRQQPNYSLTTAPVSVTNNSFTGPASTNWSAIQNSSTATITAVASPTDTGATLRISQTAASTTLSGPNTFAPYVGAATSTFTGGSFVVGTKYRVNFRLRKEFAVSFSANYYPICEIVQSGNVVATKSCDDAGDSTAAFNSYYVDFIATTTTATFNFKFPTGPPYAMGGDFYNATGWNFTYGGFYDIQTVGATDNSGVFLGYLTDWDSDWRSGQTYNIQGAIIPNQSGNYIIKVYDGNDPGSPGTQLYTTGPTAYTAGSVIGINASFTAASANLMLSIYLSSQNSAFRANIYGLTVAETGAINRVMGYIDTINPIQIFNGIGIYNNQDAGAIAQGLLAQTNADSASRIVAGSTQITQPRTRTYQQFSNVGNEIKALSDIESGYDFKVDPVIRTLDIYNRTNATNFPAVVGPGQAGVGTWIYSADRTSTLRFDYGTGADNLSSVSKSQDSSTVVNRLNVKGKYALGFAQDTTSQSTYGLFEDLISLPDVIDASTSILPFYANAEIAFRKNPKISYSIETKSSPSTPKLFIDFNIGDRAVLNIGAQVLASSSSNPINQQIRIFGVQLSVDAEGNEHLSDLQLSA